MPQGPVLDDEKLGEFAHSVAGQPADESAGTPPAGASPGPDAAVPAVGTQPPAGQSPEPEKDDDAGAKGPIPYERFRDVNEARKAALAKQAEFEAELAKYKAGAEEQGRAVAISMLTKIAETHPELKPLIYGTETPETVSPEAKPPEDPKEKRLWELEREAKENRDFRETTRRNEQFAELSDRCEAQMEKHPEYKVPSLRKLGEQIIAHQLLTRGNVAPERIVEETAKLLRDAAEEQKVLYREQKAAPPKKIAPGAGSGGAAPPGAAPAKVRIEDGSAMRALAAAIRAGQAE